MINTSSKRYAPLELKQISQVFASKYTGENKEPNYLTGEDLVDLFNCLGFKDDYIYENGGIIADDFENRPSRAQYTLARLRKLNDEGRLSEAMLTFINSVKTFKNTMNILFRYTYSGIAHRNLNTVNTLFQTNGNLTSQTIIFH